MSQSIVFLPSSSSSASFVHDWWHFRYKNQDEDLLPNADTIALSPHKIKCHHPNCPKMNSPHIDHQQQLQQKMMHSQKVQTSVGGETSSICGSIHIQGNCNNSQLSSPDISETTDTRKYLSAINLNDDRSGSVDEKQKTILLKIPGVIKGEQLTVSVLAFCAIKSVHSNSIESTALCLCRVYRVRQSIWVHRHRPDVDHRWCSTNTLFCIRHHRLSTTIPMPPAVVAVPEAMPSLPTTITAAAARTFVCRRKRLKLAMGTYGRWVCRQRHRFLQNQKKKKNANFFFYAVAQVNLGHNLCSHAMNNILTDCSDLNFNDTMTCQELLAFSVAFSAALPTSQNTLESFYSSLTRNDTPNNADKSSTTAAAAVSGVGAGSTADGGAVAENFSCCYHLYQNSTHVEAMMHYKTKNKYLRPIVAGWRSFSKVASFIRRCIRILVDHKYFQQGILLAILINTLSMGIEYHDQPTELTAIVETSNIVFSGIFAVEMLLKVIAEGPFRYIANGFNVFDGVIVILRYEHIEGEGNAVQKKLFIASESINQSILSFSFYYRNTLKCIRIGRAISGRRWRQFRIECAAYISFAAYIEVGSIHAESPPSIVCDASHNGQCRNILFVAHSVHIHIQVSQSLRNSKLRPFIMKSKFNSLIFIWEKKKNLQRIKLFFSNFFYSI